jgi:hypothetical protein
MGVGRCRDAAGWRVPLAGRKHQFSVAWRTSESWARVTGAYRTNIADLTSGSSESSAAAGHRSAGVKLNPPSLQH